MHAPHAPTVFNLHSNVHQTPTRNPGTHCTGGQLVDILQGRGTIYSGAVDCISQVARTEGVAVLYRGFWAHYMRVGPHYIITFTLLEQLKIALGA